MNTPTPDWFVPLIAVILIMLPYVYIIFRIDQLEKFIEELRRSCIIHGACIEDIYKRTKSE